MQFSWLRCENRSEMWESAVVHGLPTVLRRCKTKYSRYWAAAAGFASCICSNSAISSSGRSRRLPLSLGINNYMGSFLRVNESLLNVPTFNPLSGSSFVSQRPHRWVRALSRFSASRLIIWDNGSLISSSDHCPSISLKETTVTEIRMCENGGVLLRPYIKQLQIIAALSVQSAKSIVLSWSL